MHRQLMLWSIVIDLAAKLKAEKQANVKVFYHFCGVPLPMHNTQRTAHE
jgi:hypothetical protein